MHCEGGAGGVCVQRARAARCVQVAGRSFVVRSSASGARLWCWAWCAGPVCGTAAGAQSVGSPHKFEWAVRGSGQPRCAARARSEQCPSAERASSMAPAERAPARSRAGRGCASGAPQNFATPLFTPSFSGWLHKPYVIRHHIRGRGREVYTLPMAPWQRQRT